MDKNEFLERTRNCIKCCGAHFHRQGNLHKEEQGRRHPFIWGRGRSIRPTYEGSCLQRAGHARRSVLRSTDSGLRTGHAGLVQDYFGYNKFEKLENILAIFKFISTERKLQCLLWLTFGFKQSYQNKYEIIYIYILIFVQDIKVKRSYFKRI